MDILLLAAIIGLLPAYIAHTKGRGFLLWWIYGTLLFILALPHSLLLRSNKRKLEYRQLAQGMRKCVYCAEMIKQEAMICKFCGKGYVQDNQSISVKAPIDIIPKSSKNSLSHSGKTLNEYYRELHRKQKEPL